MAEANVCLDDLLMPAHFNSVQRLDVYRGGLDNDVSAWLRFATWYCLGRPLVSSALPGSFWRHKWNNPEKRSHGAQTNGKHG